MGALTLSIQYKKNTGIVISPVELIQLYFFGISPVDIYGNRIPDETIEFNIESAQKQMENYLSIKFSRQEITESRDFYFDDFMKWGTVNTTYPVVAVSTKALEGYINTSLQLSYPDSWVSFKKQTPDEDLYYRNINLVPVAGSASGGGSNVVFLGVTAYMGFFGNRNVPNYWTVKYITGYHKIPKDILDVIGKMAAIPVFTMLADIAFGAAGISSKSLSIDGLSQSVSSTASSMYSAYSARITQYEKDIERMNPILTSRYVGITIGAL